MSKTRKGWALVAITSLLYIYDFILRVSPGVMSNEMMPWLGVDALQWSIISGMFYYGYALMQIPAGMLIDHYGARRPLIIGCILSTLCTCVPLVCHSYSIILISRLIMGMAASLAYVGPLVIARRYLPLSSFALACGLVQVLGCLGAIAGTTVVLGLLHTLNLYHTLQFITFIGVLISIIFIAFIPHDPLEHPKKLLSWRQEAQTLKQILSIKANYLTGFLALCLWCPVIIFLETWGMAWLQLIGHNLVFSMSIMTLGWVMIALGGPLAGWLSTHYKSRRSVIIGALLLNLIGAMSWLLAPHYLGLSLLAIILFSLGSSAQCVTFGIIADTHSEDRIGTAIGFNNMAIICSGFTVLPLVGYWIQKSDSQQATEAVAYFMYGQSVVIILMVIAIALTYFRLKETYREQAGE